MNSHENPVHELFTWIPAGRDAFDEDESARGSGWSSLDEDDSMSLPAWAGSDSGSESAPDAARETDGARRRRSRRRCSTNGRTSQSAAQFVTMGWMGWPETVWLCDALTLELELAVDDSLPVELAEFVTELLAVPEVVLDGEAVKR